MMGTDAQKYFVLKIKPGLITDGYCKYNRNPNYLGEIILYASFAIVAQSNLVWGLFGFVWCYVMTVRMWWKDYQLSRKDGWEEYKKQTWLFLFKICDSDILTLLFYSSLGYLIHFIYSRGGIEATMKEFLI